MPGKLDFVLTLDSSRFTRAIKAAEKHTVTASRRMAAEFNRVGRAAGAMAKKTAMIGAGLSVGAGLAGLYKFKQVMGEAIDLANTQEDAEARLAAVIRATGGAAGLTATEMEQYAGELQKVTTFGDEVTISAMAILATFKQIKGDQFKRATRAAQDMATVMGQDLNSAITQVGKALNDPVRGVTALSRVGVQFSNDQREMIKTLVESGRSLEAQKIILAELEGQFGGAAAAARDVFGGAMKGLDNAVGDFKEELGFAITKNRFFIDGLHLLEQKVISLTGSLAENRQAGRDWAKEFGLSVLTGAEAGIAGLDMLYRSFSALEGAFRTTAAASLYVSGGIFKIIEAITWLTDKLHITSGATDEWKINAEAAFAAAGDLAGKARQDFADMADGSERLGQAKDALAEFSERMKDIEASEVKKPVQEAATATEQYRTKLVKVNGVWKEQVVGLKKVDSEIDKIVRKFDRLDGRTVTVKVLEKTIQQRRFGGMIHALRSGGRLPGYGGGDRIPALLEAGEYVIRKEAVSRFGAGVFHALNSLRMPTLPALPEWPRFATGGPVAAGAGDGAAQVINLTIPDLGTYPVQADRMTTDRLLRDIARRRRLRSA